MKNYSVLAVILYSLFTHSAFAGPCGDLKIEGKYQIIRLDGKLPAEGGCWNPAVVESWSDGATHLVVREACIPPKMGQLLADYGPIFLMEQDSRCILAFHRSNPDLNMIYAVQATSSKGDLALGEAINPAKLGDLSLIFKRVY